MKKIIPLFAAVVATLLALTSCDGLNEETETEKGQPFNATYSAQDGDHTLKIMFADDSTVRFYQDDALCGAATYTVSIDGNAHIATAIFTKPWGNVSAADTAKPLTAIATFNGDDLRIALNGKTLTFVKNTTSSETTNPGNNDDDNGDNDTDNKSPSNDDNNNGDDDDNTNSGGNDGDNKTPGNDDNNNGDDDDKNNVAIIPRGSRIAATYEQKIEFAFYREDIGDTGSVIMTMGRSVSGRYTDMRNGDLTLRIPLESDESDEVVYLAKFSSGTMMLYYYDEDGNLNEHALTFTRKATNSDPSAQTEWEYTGPLSLTFALDGTVQFFEDSALCWTGTYTVTEDNFAVTKDIQQVGSPWDNMTLPVKVEFTFDRNALMWDVLYGNGRCSSFLTRAGDITVETTTSGGNTETTPGGDGDDDKSDDDEHDAGVFKNGAIDATYVQKLTLTFSGGIVTYNANGISTDNSTTYTQDGDSRTFDFLALIGASDDMETTITATATINGNELTLNTVSSYKDDDGEMQTASSERIFKKSSTGIDSWEYATKMTLSSQKTVSFYENDKLCWTGTYAITDERHATVSNVTIADQAIFDSIFGNDMKVVTIQDEDSFFWICCKLEGQDTYYDIGILK